MTHRNQPSTIKPGSKSSVLLLAVALLLGCGGDEPTISDDVPPACEGKCDWFGNRVLGESCSWNWQCSADQGLVCRPISRVVDGQWNTASECAPYGDFLETCDSESDCSAGLFCKESLCSRRETGDNACEGGQSEYCDGNVLVRCGYYVIERRPCPEGTTCSRVDYDLPLPDGQTVKVSKHECVE